MLADTNTIKTIKCICGLVASEYYCIDKVVSIFGFQLCGLIVADWLRLCPCLGQQVPFFDFANVSALLGFAHMLTLIVLVLTVSLRGQWF